MRKTFTLFLFMVPFCALAQKQFLIKGRVDNIHAPAKVYLFYKYPNATHSHWDSTIVKNGGFEFKGIVADTVEATIWVNYKGISLDDIWGKSTVDAKELYLTDDTTLINGDDSIHNARMSGNGLNEDYDIYMLNI